MSGIEDTGGFEVIRKAMEIAKLSHAFYRAMMDWAEDDEVREIFHALAYDEAAHLKTLEDIALQYREGAFWEREEDFQPHLKQFDEEMPFPAAEQVETLIGDRHADRKALDLAIAAEERLADFFQLAARNARTAAGKDAFAWLTAEEKRHAATLHQQRERLFG